MELTNEIGGMTLQPHPTKAQIPDELWTRVRVRVRSTSGLTGSKLVRDGLEQWLIAAEGEAYTCAAYGHEPQLKRAGEPYPERLGDIPQGRPFGDGDSQEKMRTVTFRLPEEFDERLRNALYWRNAYLSHVVRDVLKKALDH